MLGAKGRGVLLIVLLSSAASRAAFAAEIRPGKEPVWKRRMRRKLEKRVSFGFSETPVTDAIGRLQEQTDLSLTCHVGVLVGDRRITAEPEDLPLRTALARVLGEVDLDYVLREDGIFIAARDKLDEKGEIRNEPKWKFEMRCKLDRKVSLEFVDTPLTEGVQFLQTMVKMSMILDPLAIEKKGNTLVTLRITNEPLGDAFDRVFEIAGLDYAFIDGAVFVSTRERLAAEFEQRAAVALAEAAPEGQDDPEWKLETRKMLARKVSFEFVDTPFGEAIQFLQTLTRTTFVLDPGACENPGEKTVTLRVNAMSLGAALRWMASLAGLDYTFKDGAIFISTPEIIARERKKAGAGKDGF
jgi:hypothetical protein